MKLLDRRLRQLKEEKEQNPTRNVIKYIDQRYFHAKSTGAEVENILKLLKNDICSFKEIIDKSVSYSHSIAYRPPYLNVLLESESLFKELIKNNLMALEDFEYVLNKIEKFWHFDSFAKNSFLVCYLLDNNILSFKELVDKSLTIEWSSKLFDYDSERCLKKLINKQELFDTLIKNNLICLEDLMYLLNNVEYYDEIEGLCKNNPLIKKILAEFLLDKDITNRFSDMIEKSGRHIDIFKVIENNNFNKNKSSEKLLELNKLNKLFHEFSCDREQKLEIAKILRNSEVARNTFKSIIENNLLDQYSFEQLKNILTKNDNKKLKTKFNF